jgi:hypothetical protein
MSNTKKPQNVRGFRVLGGMFDSLTGLGGGIYMAARQTSAEKWQKSPERRGFLRLTLFDKHPCLHRDFV